MSALNASSLDLRSIDHQRRALVWRQAARTLFPGLKVEALRSDPVCGSIHGRQFGHGQIWSILSPPLRVDYDPVDCSAMRAQACFSVMLQLRGATNVTQHMQASLLRSDDLCLLDEAVPFNLEVTEAASQVMFLRIPRDLVLSRYPYLEHRTAQTFERDDPGTSILRSYLLGLFESAGLLEKERCSTALVSAAMLLGVPKPPSSLLTDDLHWRARSALSCIDANLADPMLNASRVAAEQKISRRRLDEILLQTLGSSVNAQIWSRRLSQAAHDLRDPSQATRTVTNIAFSAGFTNAAHFTRSFKRRYGCGPREWRSQN
jgi:AraC-like DNA-binding protein